MNSRHEPHIESCPVGCSAPLAVTDVVLPEGPLLRCTACGQLLSQASAARYWGTMTQFDRMDYNQPRGRALDRRNQVSHRRLRIIAELIGREPQKTRILDVGCSRGQFMQAAVALGFEAEGVEPAAHVAAATRAAGLKVYTGLLEEQRFATASFDALTLFEVIEHLKDPRGLLRECRRVLKPGGILAISTGNTASWTAATMKSRWDYFQMAKDGGHISFFSPWSLRQLAANCAFVVERIDTARVKFHEREDSKPWVYIAGKITAELLNLPARILGKGHDMLAYLRRPYQD
jgi:2-polyprenyl-3-methyl-5-hydroxy-6-metoxy-1,4-benzoquinol methylase